MIKKVVLFSGGIETLDYFSYQMGQAFKERGLSVFFFDLKNGLACEKHARKFIKSGETAMLTFNFEGLEREDGVFSTNSGYIWQGYDMPIYNIIADHPYFYDNRFKDLLDDDSIFPGIMNQYHHLSIDKNQQKYLNRFYPQFRDGGLFPLAGTSLVKKEQQIPVKDRDIPILFAGNYTELSFFDKYIHAINEEYAKFYMGIIDELISCPGKTVEQVAIAHCEAEMGPQKDEDYTLALHKMVFIDLYVRNYFRGKVIKTLVDEGFPVTVIGKDWDRLDVKRPNRFKIIDQTDSRACLEALSHTKISLNVMPWFKNGAHDRVFNSILNGALSLSDTSKYQCEVLPEGYGVSYFDLRKDIGSGICDNLSRLLHNDSQLQDMIDLGFEKVKNEHSWEKRAEEFLSLCYN